MATGFIGRHFSGICAALLIACPALAADVSVVGIIGDRAAVLVIDGAEPRTVRVGQTVNGVAVLGVTKAGATLEFGGKRRTVALGQHVRGDAPPGSAGRGSVTLAADTRGHFVTDAQVNGAPIRFMVDTGATLISLPYAEARRLGIDTSNAPRGTAMTANGAAAVFRVTLDTVRVGAVEIHNVDALVHQGPGLDVALLGMSFLNRVEMRRDGERLVLTKRF